MPLNIKDPEADRLARELAAKTGEPITEAVVEAEIMAISRRAAARPRRSGRTPEEIIDYNERGLPR